MAHSQPHHFELRSATLDTLLFVAKSIDISVLREELERRFAVTPDFFAGEPIAIDLRRLEGDVLPDLSQLADLLREFRMRPLGVVASEAHHPELLDCGLPLLTSPERRAERPEAAVINSNPADDPSAAVPVLPNECETASATEPQPVPGTTSIILDKPLRSGQRYFARGDLIVLDVVNHGAEIIAEGNIHVYAPLRGRALAGALGREDARIFCSCMEAELLSIAGIYRTTETPLSKDVLGKPAQVRLVANSLVIEPLKLR